MYSVTFIVDLKDDTWFQNPNEAEKIANTKTTYLPISSLAGNPVIVKKHGETFTLYGQDAAYLERNLSQFPQFKVYVPLEEDAVPEVSTIALDVFNQTITMSGEVISEGSSELIEYGFVYAANTSTPTIENNKVVVGTGSFTGSYEDEIDLMGDLDGIDVSGGDNPVYVASYATNAVGTAYGDVLITDPNPWLCLIAGTMITLADGSQKKIEDIDYEDSLLVWNFDEASSDTANPIWIMRPFTAPRYSLVQFSDGSELGTIDDGKGHSLFNIEKGMFTHMMDDNETPIGTTTYAENGSVIKIVSKKIVNEKTTFYNVVTNFHMNLFSNNILTSTGLNNIYPIKNMKFVKNNINNNESYDNNELFIGLRLAEQPVNVDAKILRMVKQQLPESILV